MRDIVAAMRSHVSSAIALFVAFVGTGAAALAFSAIVARSLQPADFSLFASLLAGVTLAGVITLGLSAATARTVALLPAQPAVPVRAGVRTDKSVRSALLLGVLISGILLATSPIWGWILSAPFRTILALAVIVPAVLISGIGYGRLYGSGRFAASQGIVLVENAIKLCAAVFVLLAAPSVVGFELALIAGPVVALMMAFSVTRALDVPRVSAFSLDVWRSSGLYLALFAGMQMDIPLARAIFPADEAGRYATVALMAKAIVGLSLVGGQFLFRSAVRGKSQGVPSAGLARTSIVLAGAASIPLAVILAALGPLIVKVVFGASYEISGGLAVAVGLGIVPWCLVAALAQVRLGQQPLRALIALAAIAVLEANLLFIAHWWGIVLFSVAFSLSGCLALIGLLLAHMFGQGQSARAASGV